MTRASRGREGWTVAPGQWTRKRDGTSVVRQQRTLAPWVPYWPDGETMKRVSPTGHLFTPRFDSAKAAATWADSDEPRRGASGQNHRLAEREQQMRRDG